MIARASEKLTGNSMDPLYRTLAMELSVMQLRAWLEWAEYATRRIMDLESAECKGSELTN